MSPFEVSASDLYLATGLLALALTVSAWFSVPLFALGVLLAALEFRA